ncbi:MAG: hypothetical protein HQL93_09670 [Magnetococcales bacterium]|nr:hypothetical protein [Magnetococcales bacterium]
MSDWGAVASKLTSIGLPLLGAALPIPGGVALGSALAGWLTGDQDAHPIDVVDAMQSPEGQAKAHEFYLQNQTTILQINVAAETAQIESVNATMRVEANAANWPTWTWRPFIGFVFATMIFGDYFVLPLLHIPVPVIPQEVFVAIMAILGVASWGHSKALADPNNAAVTRG